MHPYLFLSVDQTICLVVSTICFPPLSSKNFFVFIFIGESNNLFSVFKHLFLQSNNEQRRTIKNLPPDNFCLTFYSFSRFLIKLGSFEIDNLFYQFWDLFRIVTFKNKLNHSHNETTTVVFMLWGSLKCNLKAIAKLLRQP
jgi:hypothetical protein